MSTPFNGPKNSRICFNGEFQHSYILKLLHQYHAGTQQSHTKPRASFTAINTGHDSLGLRAQTLNLDLAEFVEDISKLENTLTILFADHGNTYTEYTTAMMEGRYEMYHPSFFMIVPKNVGKWFGKSTMDTIRLNSNRLFTMLDVHATLKGIMSRVLTGISPADEGILGAVSASRNCGDLELRLPNLCVCEGWDNAARNDTLQVGVLEFAFGSLNNMIVRQQESQLQQSMKYYR